MNRRRQPKDALAGRVKANVDMPIGLMAFSPEAGRRLCWGSGMAEIMIGNIYREASLAKRKGTTAPSAFCYHCHLRQDSLSMNLVINHICIRDGTKRFDKLRMY